MRRRRGGAARAMLGGMWVRVGWAAACFAAIMGFSRLAYGELVPAMRASLGGDYARYGEIGGANFVGYLAGALVTTRLARLPDRSAINAASLLAMCALVGATGLAQSTLELGALRFLVGVASGIALSLTLALAVERVPAERRGLAATVVWGGGALGIALVGASGLVVPGLGPNAWRLQWLAMAAAGAGCALVFARLTGGRFAAAEHADHGGPVGVFARGRYRALTLAYFAYAVGYIDVVTFFGAALARAHAIEPSVAWIVLGLAGTAGAVVWGPLLDRHRSGAPVALAAGCCAAGAALVAVGTAWAALAGALLIGASFIGVPAMVGALVQQRESPATYPRAFALLTAVLGVGQILGPTLGGAIADRAGTAGAVTFGAAMLAVAAACAAAYRRPAHESAPPAPLPRLAEAGTLVAAHSGE